MFCWGDSTSAHTDLQHSKRSSGEADPSTGQLPERGCKALAGAGKRAAVLAAAIDGGKAVEQVAAGHADVAELDSAIVHAIQAHLQA